MRKGFILFTVPYNSSSANTGQEVMQRPWRELLTGLLLVACSARFLLETRTTSPGVATPTMVWALPHIALIEKMPYRLTYNLILWRHFLSEGSPLSDDSSLSQDDKVSQHSKAVGSSSRPSEYIVETLSGKTTATHLFIVPNQ